MQLGKDKDVVIDASTWERAIEAVHANGGYNVDMLDNDAVKELINATYDTLKEGMEKGITYKVPETMTAALSHNVFIFSGFKTHEELKEVSELLKDEDGNIKPFGRFFNDVKQIDADYNDLYLKAEYRFAQQSAQMAAKWASWQRRGVEMLQYSTANDDHVRPEHALLDGITRPFDDKFWDTYLPPNGWRCRCNVVPVDKLDATETDADEAMERGAQCLTTAKDKIFAFNAGKTLTLMPPKHPYYKTKDAPKVEEKLEKQAEEVAPAVEFNAKTVAEAEDLFRARFGVLCNFKGFKKKNLDDIKEIYESVRYHFDTFPEIRSKINFIGSFQGRYELYYTAMLEELKNDASYNWLPIDRLEQSAERHARLACLRNNTYAYSAPNPRYGLNGLAYSSAWAGDKFHTAIERDVANKFHPIGCTTIKSIFDHELGHKLDELLNFRSQRTFTDYKATVTDIKNSLSGYAATSNAEFIAEAWAEYLNNPNPRPIAKTIGEMIIETYKNKAK